MFYLTLKLLFFEKQTIQMGLSVVAFLQTQTNCLGLAAAVENILFLKQMTKKYFKNIFYRNWNPSACDISDILVA